MNTYFFNQLTDNQKRELIDFVNRNNESFIPAGNITPYGYTPDALGAYISVTNGNHLVGHYMISDYHMEGIPYNNTDYSASLREYMASVFGEIYLNSLRKYITFLTDIEIERINYNLDKGRK